MTRAASQAARLTQELKPMDFCYPIVSMTLRKMECELQLCWTYVDLCMRQLYEMASQLAFLPCPRVYILA